MSDSATQPTDGRLYARLQEARAAFDSGEAVRARELAFTVVMEAPQWLPARRLLREAQQTAAKPGKRTAVTLLPWEKLRARSPHERHRRAEELLCDNPRDAAAYRLLAEAAAALQWPEVELFAREGLTQVRPDDAAAFRALAEAALHHGDYARAEEAALRWSALQPDSGEARALLRQASVQRTLAGGRWDALGTYGEEPLHEAAGSEEPFDEEAERNSPRR